MLEQIAEAMLQARETLRTEFSKLHRAMLAIVHADEVCRRRMTVPGVGALVAVTFTSGVFARDVTCNATCILKSHMHKLVGL